MSKASGDEPWTYVRTAAGGIAGNADLRTLLVVYLLVMVVTELYRKALPLYFAELSLPVELLGLALSLGNVLETVASPIVGAAADEFDRFGLAAFATVGVAAALVGIAFVVDPLAIVAFVALFAVARLSTNVAVTPAVSDALDAEFAGFGWGVRDVAIYVGSAAGLAIGGVALSRFPSVRYAFLALVPVAAVLVVLLWRRRESKTVDRDGGADEKDFVDRLPWPPSVPDVPRPSLMVRFAAVTGLSNLGMGMTLFLLPVYAAEADISAQGFLFLFSTTFVASAPLSLAGGVATDHLDRKRLYVGNFVVETLMLGAFALVGGIELFLVGTGLYVLQTAFEPAVVTFFFEGFDEDETGLAWGIDGLVSRGVGIVAPALGGFVYARDPAATFLLGAVFLAGATAVALTIPRHGDQRTTGS